MDKYEEQLARDIERIDTFTYKDIASLHKFPLTISKQVLRILIEYACLGQNYGPIELARRKIEEIDKNWLKNYFVEVAKTCINFSDEWEYRRLVELIIVVLPELKQEVLKLGEQSENEEVREVVEDYCD